MATQAKRYGLEVRDDLEVELRFRRIEQQLERLVGADDLTGDGSTKRLLTPPKVTGLRVVGSTPGAITLAWNAVPISDLRRYELEIAEDIGFSVNKQVFFVAGTQFQFSTVAADGGGGGTVIFARVRARNRAGIAGPYSITLNTSTGQAQSDDIGEGQVTAEQISNTTLEGLTLVTTDGTHTFDPTTRLTFNPNAFYLSGDNAGGDDPIVNLSSGTRSVTASGVVVTTALFKTFIGTPQSVPAGGNATLSFTHGLASVPSIVQTWLKCVTADAGYTAGEVIRADGLLTNNQANNQSMAVKISSTSIEVNLNNNGGLFFTLNGGTHAEVELTEQNWALYVTAMAFA